MIDITIDPSNSIKRSTYLILIRFQKVYTVDLATTQVTDDGHQVTVNQGAYTNNETTIGCQNLSVTPFSFTYGVGGILHIEQWVLLQH